MDNAPTLGQVRFQPEESSIAADQRLPIATHAVPVDIEPKEVGGPKIDNS